MEDIIETIFECIVEDNPKLALPLLAILLIIILVIAAGGA